MTKTKVKLTPLKLDDDAIFLSSKSKSDDGDENPEEKDEDEDEDEGIDERSHAQLLSDLGKLSKRKKAARDVRVSLGGSSKKVDTSDILSRLGTKYMEQENKKLTTTTKPLEKHAALRAKRAAGLEKVTIEVNKWENLVYSRRRAEQLSFPVENADVRIMTSEKAQTTKPKTSLEKKVYELLKGANLEEKKETDEEKATKRAMSLMELKERNAEIWRQREMKRRYEEKSRLQNKSKSRKYHRILRKERLKKEKQELEMLEKTDPDAALERLNNIEHSRIHERMSLRHKRSKWAKQQGLRVRDTKDQTAKSALEENERMYRELTRKLKVNNKDGEEHDSEDEELLELLKDRQAAIDAGEYDPMNPWTKKVTKNDSGIEDNGDDKSFSRFKRFWEEVNKRKIVELEAQKFVEENERSKQSSFKLVKEKNVQIENKQDGTAKEIKENEDVDQIEEKESKEEKENEGGKSNSEESELDEVEERPTKKRKFNNEDNNENEQDKEFSIDSMFDDAEMELKKKVKRRLEKLGVDVNKPVEWNTIKRRKKNKQKKGPPNIQEFDFSSENMRDNLDEGLSRAKTMDDMENLQTAQGEGTISKNDTGNKKENIEDKLGKGEPKKKKIEVDPTKFIKVNAKSLRTAMPDNVTKGGEGLDDSEEELEEDPEDLIREAFEDDYLIDEFKSEKEAAINKNNVELSLALPGWGDWTGPNIKVSNRKRKRFKIRTPKAPPRKDASLGNVIYNEEADVHENLRKTMVSELPYPFKSVKDFEASIRAPVGRMFVPENAHRKLTAPPIVTKMGTVIDPIDEDQLLKKKLKKTLPQSEPQKSKKEMGKNEKGNNKGNQKGDKNKKRNNRGNQKGQKNRGKIVK